MINRNIEIGKAPKWRYLISKYIITCYYCCRWVEYGRISWTTLITPLRPMVYISLFNVTHSKFDSVKNALSKYYNSFGVLPTMVRVKLNKKTSSVGENNQSWQWFYSVSVIDSLRVKSTPIRARYLPVLKKKILWKAPPINFPGQTVGERGLWHRHLPHIEIPW